MLTGASRVRDLLKYMERLRMALPGVKEIWGAWMADQPSYKSKFKLILEVETTLRKLLREGKVSKEQTVCIDPNLAAELGPSSFLLAM
ncbi:hypothetical protein V5O48_019340 [Marasmius crinis-equi]|uniref:Uncharacterized protein n=1 Tax=Marasmius crinis-equi TaxID=585013 RepID=A0ABR3EIQ6_9AGAR